MPTDDGDTVLAENDPIDILYIIGSGRSGSTLLGNLLGTQEAFVNVGEIYNFRHFFDTAREQQRLCSCGAALDSCPYWERVAALAGARAETGRLDLKHGDMPTLHRHNYAVFSVIREFTDKRVIVDSSKRFNRLQMLLSSPQFRVTVLHLVRDGRAFAFSAMVSAMKRGLPHTRYFFRRLLKWQSKNLGIRLTFARLPRYHLLRYEDFVRGPEQMLDEIAQWFGTTFDASRLDCEDRQQVHEFSGNKRFISRHSLEVRQDVRYLDELDSAKWVPGSLLAAPALWLFGYPFRRNRCRL